jgi:hypothetical protein
MLKKQDLQTIYSLLLTVYRAFTVYYSPFQQKKENGLWKTHSEQKTVNGEWLVTEG